jgi:hypothetical protein
VIYTDKYKLNDNMLASTAGIGFGICLGIKK